MSRAKQCLIVLAAIACWTGCRGAEATIRLVGVTLNCGIEIKGARVCTIPNGARAEIGTLRSSDGMLEVKADNIVVVVARTQKDESPQHADLSGKVSVKLQIKGEAKIEASAAEGHIDWQNQVIELNGNVSVTAFQPVSGKVVPSTIHGASVRILMAEKLGKGQERVQVTEPVSKDGTKETPR
jgi:hypothetical protein